MMQPWQELLKSAAKGRAGQLVAGGLVHGCWQPGGRAASKGRHLLLAPSLLTWPSARGDSNHLIFALRQALHLACPSSLAPRPLEEPQKNQGACRPLALLFGC